ncbi:radical SAM protein [Nonomuraea phyllanthi]|uniref:Radical SAM protein n=1 Tax=Nonomuraea phyllanthi TaxID=2219224 RepID=A0A5C4WK28_9ACTN|nr:radical SAM protein [Nonomuraea phyllanthi]KAB8194182.1 radical SAM protein [Nonomuraea phyllanthi]QFY07782.1 radical SAM protein [Nonomuraea phyllanthi]
MTEKTGRYFVVSDRTYTDDSGIQVRLVYATRTARLLFVIPQVADALRAGRLDVMSPGMLATLREAQVVVPAEQDELAEVLERDRSAARDRSQVDFILLPTSYCNMGCTYCGQEHVRGGLTADHRDRVRARVLRAARLATTRRLRVDWFGSEPMMGYAIIRDLSKDFVRVAGEAGVEYSSQIVTNGYLLNERNLEVLIKECRVGRFYITLDGPPEIHDVHRPLKSGKGSFWKIVRTVRAALDHPDYQDVVFQFRTNVDVHNQDGVARFIELMAELGFTRPNVHFSLDRVRPWSNDVSAIELAAKDFARRELDWLRLMQELGLPFTRLPHTVQRVTCPAVKAASELISGTGKIFSCTDHPLVPRTEETAALGHIGQDDLPVFRPAGEFDGWYDEIAQGRSWCRDCVFLPTCGGSCPKAWHEGNPPCPSYKHNVQGRLDLAAERIGLRPVQAG